MTEQPSHGFQFSWSRLVVGAGRRVAILAALTGGLAIAGIVALVGYLAYIEPEFELLEAEGNVMIRRIELFRDQHGRYPLTAAEAEVDLPKTRWGTWKYLARDGASSFELSVGEYEGLDPFMLNWDSDRGSWYRDT